MGGHILLFKLSLSECYVCSSYKVEYCTPLQDNLLRLKEEKQGIGYENFISTMDWLGILCVAL